MFTQVQTIPLHKAGRSLPHSPEVGVRGGEVLGRVAQKSLGVTSSSGCFLKDQTGSLPMNLGSRSLAFILPACGKEGPSCLSPYNFPFKVYLSTRKSYGDRSLPSSTDDHNGQYRARAKPGARSFHWGSYVGTGIQTFGPSSAFLGH